MALRNPFRDLIGQALWPAHPLADAAAPCGGPASCGCCAVELWREEAARGREIDAGSIAGVQMVPAEVEHKRNICEHERKS